MSRRGALLCLALIRRRWPGTIHARQEIDTGGDLSHTTHPGLDALWLTEAVRLREEQAGPLEDSGRFARRWPRAVPCLSARAHWLGRREGLLDAQRTWRQGSRLALALLLVLAWPAAPDWPSPRSAMASARSACSGRWPATRPAPADPARLGPRPARRRRGRGRARPALAVAQRQAGAMPAPPPGAGAAGPARPAPAGAGASARWSTGSGCSAC